MANVAEKFGLRPYRKLDGTPLVGAQNRYIILLITLLQFSKVIWLFLTTAGTIDKTYC